MQDPNNTENKMPDQESTGRKILKAVRRVKKSTTDQLVNTSREIANNPMTNNVRNGAAGGAALGGIALLMTTVPFGPATAVAAIGLTSGVGGLAPLVGTAMKNSAALIAQGAKLVWDSATRFFVREAQDSIPAIEHRDKDKNDKSTENSDQSVRSNNVANESSAAAITPDVAEEVLASSSSAPINTTTEPRATRKRQFLQSKSQDSQGARKSKEAKPSAQVSPLESSSAAIPDVAEEVLASSSSAPIATAFRVTRSTATTFTRPSLHDEQQYSEDASSSRTRSNKP